MDGERDPRPARAGADQGDALGLADQREGVFWQRRSAGRGLEAVWDRVERRREASEQALKVGLAAQPCLRLRVASVRRRSALRRMKPAASRWL